MAITETPPLVESRGRPAGYAGLAFAVLSAVSLWLVADMPSSSASDTEITEFYTGSSKQAVVVVGLYVVPFAGIAFCWFMSAFRDRIVRLAGAEDQLMSTVQILSGVLFVAMTFAASAAVAATALAVEIGDKASPPSADMTRQLLIFGEALRMVYALRVAAVFMIAGTTRARRAGLMPRWLVVASYLGALVLLVSASYALVLTLVFPLWVAVVSVLILKRRSHRADPVAA